MLLYWCFNIDISGAITQYLKMFPKFSCGAELQPLRASRPLSFPQTRRFGVRESKPKFLTPNSVSTMAEITPTSLLVEIPETSENPTYYANTNSRTVIQITKKCTTLTLQRVYSLTHTHKHTLALAQSWLIGQSRERGGNMSSVWRHAGYNSKLARLLYNVISSSHWS